jgi:hypothetical protein
MTTNLPDFAGMTHSERYDWLSTNGHNVWLWRDDTSGLWAYCRAVKINAERDAQQRAAVAEADAAIARRDGQAYRLTFHVAAAEDEDGEPTEWEVGTVEMAELLSRSDERMTFRTRDEQGSLEWDAYRFDFGGDLGVRWAYGSSAELLTVEMA